MLNIIITGASRGIGKATATAFFELPEVRIGIIARNQKALLDFETKNRHHHSEIVPLPFDFDKGVDQIDKLANDILTRFSQVDILINNAGTIDKKPFGSFNHTDYEHLFRVNVFAPGLLIRALLPLLRKSEIRHVVNIGSMGGFQGSVRFPGMTLYSATKAALANLTESLAAEYNDDDIRFNCLAPGAVQTEMFTEAFPGYKAPVSPAEMGIYVRDFSMTAYRFMNGKVIPVSLSTP
jgi:3-oxoacyl-[acyl-carrier protein] reductase